MCRPGFQHVLQSCCVRHTCTVSSADQEIQLHPSPAPSNTAAIPTKQCLAPQTSPDTADPDHHCSCVTTIPPHNPSLLPIPSAAPLRILTVLSAVLAAGRSTPRSQNQPRHRVEVCRRHAANTERGAINSDTPVSPVLNLIHVSDLLYSVSLAHVPFTTTTTI